MFVAERYTSGGTPATSQDGHAAWDIVPPIARLDVIDKLYLPEGFTGARIGTVATDDLNGYALAEWILVHGSRCVQFQNLNIFNDPQDEIPGADFAPIYTKGIENTISLLRRIFRVAIEVGGEEVRRVLMKEAIFIQDIENKPFNHYAKPGGGWYNGLKAAGRGDDLRKIEARLRSDLPVAINPLADSYAAPINSLSYGNWCGVQSDIAQEALLKAIKTAGQAEIDPGFLSDRVGAVGNYGDMIAGVHDPNNPVSYTKSRDGITGREWTPAMAAAPFFYFLGATHILKHMISTMISIKGSKGPTVCIPYIDIGGGAPEQANNSALLTEHRAINGKDSHVIFWGDPSDFQDLATMDWVLAEASIA